jgi:hypothetical protein
MAGRDSTNGNRQSRNAKVRRYGVVAGAAVGAFVAAAAMATGSAAPAKADLDDLLDPIIQPLVTSLSDAIAGFDPAAATDLTSWSDSLLSSLNSIDLALPSATEPATAVAAAASPASDPTSGTYDIPITVQEDTEPTVQATIDGQSTNLLVDTGSSGLVIPYTDLGSSSLQQLENLFSLGLPSSFGESGYSGGVDYIYLTYDNVSTDYGNGALDTTGPVDVEIFSWPTSASSPANFQDFLNDNDVTGILGIGDNSAGPTESPLESDGYPGVLVDVPQDKLIVEPTDSIASGPLTPIATLDGAPTPTSNLTETVTNSAGQLVGTGSVSDDVDSGGVYGTIPSSIDPSTLAQGDKVTVYDGSTPLYSYNVGTDSDGTDEAPEVTSGTSIDSGIEPFEQEPIYINYTDDTLTFNEWGT